MQRAVLLDPFALQDKTYCRTDCGCENECGAAAQGDAAGLGACDQAYSGKADQGSGPGPDIEHFLQHHDGEEGHPDAFGLDEEAGRPGGHRDLPHVQKHAVAGGSHDAAGNAGQQIGQWHQGGPLPQQPGNGEASGHGVADRRQRQWIDFKQCQLDGWKSYRPDCDGCGNSKRGQQRRLR